MTAFTEKIVSGAYSSTWNALDVGNVALGGYRMRYSYLQKEINFDAVGLTPVDTLFTGLIMMLDFVCMQYNSAAIQAMRWPFSSTPGIANSAGFSMWDAAKPFIMTACTGTNANPLSRTFPKTILAPGFEVIEDSSGVQEKVVPMRLIVFPIQATSTNPSTPYSRPVACQGNFYYSEVVPVT